MNNQQALTVVDTLVFNKKGKYLSDIQRLLLDSSLSDPRLRYDDIAKNHGYSLNYFKQYVGPKLWQMLSDVCGEKVSKTNFRAALERQWDRAILDPIEVTIPTTVQTEQIAASTPAVLTVSPIVPTRHLDWGDAPDVDLFYNRTQELEILSRWIVNDGCRLVVLSGMGGIGKTHLSIKLAEQIQPHFQYVIWRSLVPAKPLSELVIDLLKSLTQRIETNLPTGLEEQISMLIHVLKKSKCLLILDNAETLLKSGVLAGRYQADYQNYQTFFQRIGACHHQSCLLLTTREQPQGITLMQGDELPVRSLKLAGLNVEAGQELLQSRGCFVESAACLQLTIDKYGGNPLILKIASAIASELYDGDISAFIQSKSSICREIGDVLDQQLDRLRDSEKSFLYWLTIEQRPIDWVELNSGSYPGILPEAIVETVRSLLHRSLIEKQNKKFCLQPVVREYLQHKVTEQIIAEIESENLLLLDRYPLLRSTAKEDFKQAQIDLIIKPLLARLLIIYKTPTQICTKLKKILANLQTEQALEPGYAAGNIINLLGQLQVDIDGCDFSHLTVRSGCLQKTNLQNVNFAGADLSQSVFAKQLTNILTVAYSPDGQSLATGDVNGEIQLWDIATGEPILSCTGHAGWVDGIAFSPDGKLLGIASSDQTVKLWDTFDGSCIKTLTGYQHRVRSIAFSPDGKLLASGSSDATIRLWNIDSGECSNIWSGHQSYVWSVAFSPDGATIASGSEDKSIRLWERATGGCQQILTGHHLWVCSIAFSRDGKLLASGSGDRSIKIWNLSTGKCQNTLTGHTPRLRSIAFSPDGKLLASGSNDSLSERLRQRTIGLWHVADGQCLKTLHGDRSLLSGGNAEFGEYCTLRIVGVLLNVKWLAFFDVVADFQSELT